MSQIEDAVMAKIYKRAVMGKAKYGVTMMRDDLTELEWLVHGQEEAMDLAVYFERLIQDKRKELGGNNGNEKN